MNLTRDFIENSPKFYMQKGKPKQSDVFIVEWNSIKIVIKDYKHKSIFMKLLGSFLIKRESQNYQFLNKNNIKFVPKFYGKIDKYALGIEYINAKTINDIENREEYSSIPQQMKEHLVKLHKLKFFHIDLRKKANLLIKDNSLFFLDFAGSLYFRKFNPFYNLLKGFLLYVDNSAILKCKAFICPLKITGEDYKKLLFFEQLRQFWFFTKPRKPVNYSNFKDRI